MSPLVETTLEDLERMWSMNTASAFLCCREAAKLLRSQRPPGGRILNVASRQAVDPRAGTGMVAYTTSKAALGALTLAIAEELAAAILFLGSPRSSSMRGGIVPVYGGA